MTQSEVRLDRAGELRDREMEIKAEIRAIAQGKTGSAAVKEKIHPLSRGRHCPHCRFLDWCAGEQAHRIESEKLHMEDTYINDQLVKKKQQRFPAIRRARVGLKN